MLDSPSSPAYFVVESTLTNLPGPQSIKLSKSQPYFDNSNAPAVSAAQVRVSDDAGNTYVFTESTTPGTYTWTPKDPSEVFGKVGRTYSLAVSWSGSSFYHHTTIGDATCSKRKTQRLGSYWKKSSPRHA